MRRAGSRSAGSVRERDLRKVDWQQLFKGTGPTVFGGDCDHGARPAIVSFCTGAGRAAANVLGLPGPHYTVAGDGVKIQKIKNFEAPRRLRGGQCRRGGKTIGRGR